MRSGLHPNCNDACRGNPAHPQHVRWVYPTPEDWERWADELRTRYSTNVGALEAISRKHLTGSAGEEEEEEENGNGAGAGVGVGDGDGNGAGVGDRDGNQAGAGVGMGVGVGAGEGAGAGAGMAAGVREDTPSNPPTVERALVDRSASPIQLPWESRTPSPYSPSPTPPTTTSTPLPRRLDDFDTPWVEPSHFSGTSFFTDPLTIAFVEDPIRQTTKTQALNFDSWMCQNLLISNPWHKIFMKHFPKLAFNDKTGEVWWEWVSRQ
jgi:hypothetical protein